MIAVLLPAAFHFAAGDDIVDPTEGREILAVSHGVSVSASPLLAGFLTYTLSRLLFCCSVRLESHVPQRLANIFCVVYLSYLVFQLFSHKNLYSDNNAANFQSTSYPAHKPNRFTRRFALRKKKQVGDAEKAADPAAVNGTATDPTGGETPDLGNGTVTETTHVNPPVDEEEDQPMLSVPMTIGLLIVVTVVCLTP